jgi:two-component system phosphate regulon response regulator PhoB
MNGMERARRCKQTKRARGPGMTVTGDGQQQRPRAFVIEDDVHTQRLLAELIASKGMEPVPFARLSSARRALAELPPAVMVVDDELPDGRGAELVRELRDDPRMRDVRVLFCTAAEPARQREMSRLAPVIAKPFRLHEMERALSEVASA